MQEAADESLHFVGKNQFAGEKYHVRKFPRDLQTHPPQLGYDVGRETGAQLRMEPQIVGELAILIQIFAHPILEFPHFFGSLQKRGIYFADPDEHDIAELVSEQLSNRDQSRQPEAVIATD